MVERAQLQIASLNDKRTQLEAIVGEVEAAFDNFGLTPMSDEDLSEKIKENQNMAHEIALKIKQRAATPP